MMHNIYPFVFTYRKIRKRLSTGLCKPTFLWCFIFYFSVVVVNLIVIFILNVILESSFHYVGTADQKIIPNIFFLHMSNMQRNSFIRITWQLVWVCLACTVCPGSSDPSNLLYKWVTTSWTYSTNIHSYILCVQEVVTHSI